MLLRLAHRLGYLSVLVVRRVSPDHPPYERRTVRRVFLGHLSSLHALGRCHPACTPDRPALVIVAGLLLSDVKQPLSCIRQTVRRSKNSGPLTGQRDRRVVHRFFFAMTWGLSWHVR